ncbi:MAG: cytochrome ubiquinol oxidase subunit I [Candidatus Manganitrophus sp.]|nr:cytochrome ubiquinol oxidase subunit I [Candidatus Manganitrophus sp.]
MESLVVSRWAIAVTASFHSLFATFIVGGMLMGAMAESVGVLTHDDRAMSALSHSIARTLVLISATVAFLGVILVFLLTILWPTFWTTLFRIMFWPLIFEASMFLGEAACLYPWYYSWGKLVAEDPSVHRLAGSDLRRDRDGDDRHRRLFSADPRPGGAGSQTSHQPDDGSADPSSLRRKSVLVRLRHRRALRPSVICGRKIRKSEPIRNGSAPFR